MKHLKKFESIITRQQYPNDIKSHINERELGFIKKVTGLENIWISEMDGHNVISYRNGLRSYVIEVKKEDSYYFTSIFGKKYQVESLKEFSYLVASAYYLSFFIQINGPEKDPKPYLRFIENINEKINDDIVYMLIGFEKFISISIYSILLKKIFNNNNIILGKDFTLNLLSFLENILMDDITNDWDVKQIVNSFSFVKNINLRKIIKSNLDSYPYLADNIHIS